MKQTLSTLLTQLTRTGRRRKVRRHMKLIVRELKSNARKGYREEVTYCYEFKRFGKPDVLELIALKLLIKKHNLTYERVLDYPSYYDENGNLIEESKVIGYGYKVKWNW